MRLVAASVAVLLSVSMAAGQAAAGVDQAGVTAVSGAVMVSHQGQFTRALAGRTLSRGDRVVALQGGAAAVRFGDGCVVQVDQTQMLTINDAASCRANGVLRIATQGNADDRVGGAAPATIAGVPVRTAYIIGGVALIGLGIGLGVSQSGGSTSP